MIGKTMAFAFLEVGNHEPCQLKSRKENPHKLTQLSSRSHPRHLVVKATKNSKYCKLHNYRIKKRVWFYPAKLAAKARMPSIEYV